MTSAPALPLHLPPLRVLADELATLPTVTRVVPDDGWGDPCSACAEPPRDAVAYIRRPFTVGTLTATYREPVCDTCLAAAVLWECTYRGAEVVHVDLIAGA